MRIITFLILILCLQLLSCKKDDQPFDTSKFIKFYSKGVSDYGYDIQQTSDGGYIIAGYTENSLDERKAYALKINPYGDLEWQKTFGDDESSVFSEFKRVKAIDNIIYLFGTKEDTSNFIKKEMYMVLVDFDGNLISEHTFGGVEDQEGNDFLKLPNTDKFILAGSSTKENNRPIGEATGVNPTGVKDCYWVRTNLVDTIYETLQAGGSGDDYVNSITATNEGSYVFSGSVLDFDRTSLSGNNCSIIRVDLDGGKFAQNQSLSFGSSGNDNFAKIAARDNILVVAGNINNNAEAFLNTTGERTALNDDDIDDNTLTTPLNNIDGVQNLIINDFKIISDGSYIITGEYFNSSDKSQNGLAVINIAENGTIVWSRIDTDLGGANVGNAVVQTSDGGYAVVGNTGFASDRDIILLKLNEKGEL